MKTTTMSIDKRIALKYEMRQLFQGVYQKRKESERALREAMNAFSSVQRDAMFKRLFAECE